MKQVQQVHLLTEPTIAQTFNRITNLVPLKFQSYHMLQLCWAAVFVSTTTNNNNKVQTKTATPLHHIFFLFLYKGVETNSATPSLFFDPPPKKQPDNKHFTATTTSGTSATTTSGRHPPPRDVWTVRGACAEAEGVETRFSIYALKISLFLETPGSFWIPMEQYGRFKRLLRVYETPLRVMLLVMLIVTG